MMDYIRLVKSGTLRYLAPILKFLASPKGRQIIRAVVYLVSLQSRKDISNEEKFNAVFTELRKIGAEGEVKDSMLNAIIEIAVLFVKAGKY